MVTSGAIVVTVALAVVFFLVIPGSGAFLVRRRWRRFRRALLDARVAPSLSYAASHDLSDDRPFRFDGRLEAMQADHTIWVGDSSLSVMVNLDRIPVYVLPHAVDTAGEPADETPQVLYWNDFSALAEGTRVFVCGSVELEAGTIRFGAGAGTAPLVILYDGEPETMVSRAIWSGRQRNEYWNHLTPISLIGGFVSETFWAVTVVGQSRLVAIFALVAALVPALPLLPPGVVGFYWYRRIWRSARRIRARRDLASVQQEFTVTAAYGGRRTAGGGTMSREAARLELTAVVILLTGIGLNGYLLAVAVALLLR